MIDRCTATLGALTSEGGGVLLLVGPSGIGKSTLARTLQQRLVPDQALLVRATHPDLEPALGLWSRLASLAALDEQTSPEPTANDRFATVVGLLRRLATRGATPVVLDDLHAADPDSLTLLAHLAPVLSATGATMIATSRGADAVADELGRAAHRALESQARMYEVAPLDTDQVRQRLVHHAAGHAVADALVEAFTRESGGNPLLLEGLLQLLLFQIKAERFSETQGDGLEPLPEAVWPGHHAGLYLDCAQQHPLVAQRQPAPLLGGQAQRAASFHRRQGSAVTRPLTNRYKDRGVGFAGLGDVNHQGAEVAAISELG
jgi:predicted ATPase